MSEQEAGFFRPTANEQVMEKVDSEGDFLGFSGMRISTMSQHPVEVVLV